MSFVGQVLAFSKAQNSLTMTYMGLELAMIGKVVKGCGKDNG